MNVTKLSEAYRFFRENPINDFVGIQVGAYWENKRLKGGRTN